MIPKKPQNDIDIRHATLVMVFPTVDPDFLYQKAVEFGSEAGSEEELNHWIDENFGQKDFPTRADYEKRTKDMGRLRKAIHDYWPSQLSEDPKVPLPDRTLDQVISLSDLNISIRKGSFTVIVGATGSGKSTLLSAMLGQLLYIPEKVIKEVGDRTRPIKEGEQRYLEESILSTDLTDGSPIQYSGTTGFCEQ